MKVNYDLHPHFSTIASEARDSLPVNAPRWFEDGFNHFLQWYYLACLTQEVDNQQEDGWTYIDFNIVCTDVLNEINQIFEEKAYKGDIKEFWQGYFFAQEVTHKIFYLAYTPDIQAA